MRIVLFLQLYAEQLPPIIPFIDRGVDIQALIALQADQFAVENIRQGPPDLGLADPGIALKQQGPA